MYEDVPVSPPGYRNVKVEEVEDLVEWELEGEGIGERERRSGSGSRERRG